jgi:hypothetical protein
MDRWISSSKMEWAWEITKQHRIEVRQRLQIILLVYILRIHHFWERDVDTRIVFSCSAGWRSASLYWIKPGHSRVKLLPFVNSGLDLMVQWNRIFSDRLRYCQLLEEDLYNGISCRQRWKLSYVTAGHHLSGNNQFTSQMNCEILGAVKMKMVVSVMALCSPIYAGELTAP